LIRPADEPKMSKALFEWEVALAEALTAGLSSQTKWIIKHREMQLLASRNFLLPQLDASGLYRMRGFGKDLFDTPDNRYPGIFSSAWANLASAKFQEWQLASNFRCRSDFAKVTPRFATPSCNWPRARHSERAGASGGARSLERHRRNEPCAPGARDQL